MDGGKLVGDLNEVAKKRLPDHEMAVVVTVFLIAKVVESSPAKMVRLSRCQQRNKNIENLIVNLRELAVDEVKFKIEIELDYGSLSLDNIKLKDLQVKDLAVNTYRKHLEISKLPRALSKMTQIEAFNWLQTK